MHSLIKSIPVALGALALVAGCARPNPETPRACRPRNLEDPNIARVDAVLTGHNDPASKQRSQVPGGSLTADEQERRYFRDKDQSHLEYKRMGKDFDLPLCPVPSDTQTAER